MLCMTHGGTQRNVRRPDSDIIIHAVGLVVNYLPVLEIWLPNTFFNGICLPPQFRPG